MGVKSGKGSPLLWRGQTLRKRWHVGWEGYGQTESGGWGFHAKETAEAKLRGLRWQGVTVRWGQVRLIGRRESGC